MGTSFHFFSKSNLYGIDSLKAGTMGTRDLIFFITVSWGNFPQQGRVPLIVFNSSLKFITRKGILFLEQKERHQA
jgi:hypothetical protein